MSKLSDIDLEVWARQVNGCEKVADDRMESCH